MTRFYQKCPHGEHYAWEWKTKPTRGQVVRAADIIHAGNPKPLDEMRCQKCGVQIKSWHLTISYLVEVQEN